MSNRFTDNVTPLDAATLNQFENDLTALIEETGKWKFYAWTYKSECSSDKVVSCVKSDHGLTTVKGAVIVPRSTATSTSGLSGYSNVTSGTCRYGVTVSGTTVYVAFDDGTFKKGFYGLIYGE